MAKKELSVGTTVTRKETGQIGKIVNLYSGSYIVELADGDGYKHETRVVTQDSMENDYSTQKKAAAFHLNAAGELEDEAKHVESRDYKQILDKWTLALNALMMHAVTDNNPVPPSPLCTEEIQKFATQAAKDISIQQSGEVFTGAANMIAESTAQAVVAARERNNEHTYAELQKILSGPALEAVTEQYKSNKQKIEKRKTARETAKANVKPSHYADPHYMEQIAQAIWLRTDLAPYLEAKAAQSVDTVVDANKEVFITQIREKYAKTVDVKLESDDEALRKAKNDLYNAVYEQPAPPNPEDLASLGIAPEAMAKVNQVYHEKLRALSKVSSEFKRELENPKATDPSDPRYMPNMFAAMRKILPGDVANRLANQINNTNTPAEIFEAVISNAAATLSRPRTGAQTKRLNHEPKGVGRAEERAGLSESIFPEQAEASPVAEEKAMLHLREEFIRSLANGDMASANRQLVSMKETIADYKERYKPEVSAAGEGDIATPEKVAAHDAYASSVAELSRLIPGWLESAQTRILKKPKSKEEGSDDYNPPAGKPASPKPTKPTIMPKMGPRISSDLGYGTGQPVKFRDRPGVHFIVSYDDSNPLKMYLIAEQDVNSHDRTELIEANIRDVQPLKVYNIDIGDVVDAFGSVGRVTDASAKDLGYVYAELRGGNIVPVELSKTTATWHYAEPIELCRCANDGGIITPGHAANCPHSGPVPFMGVNMPAKKKKGEEVPPVDAKKQATIELMAALDNLDPAIFPAENTAPAAELYEDESNPIEIGSTVKKFGTMTTGIVVGFKRNCLVVDWENGQSEPCWKQELVLVNRQEDAAY